MILPNGDNGLIQPCSVV